MIKSGHGHKILSSVLEYENPFMQVHKHEVVRPDGAKKPYWTLGRYGSFSISIPLFPDYTTILVGQYRIPVSFYSWEFPMGQVAGATPLGMAKRELLEETGYRAKIWKKIGHYYLAPGHNEQQVYVFVALSLQSGESEPEENEFLKIKKVKIDDVGEMIKLGKIKDGPTIVAYHYLEDYHSTI